MGEGWFSGLTAAAWAPALAAFVFGLATGWLIWGGLRAGQTGEGAPAAPDAKRLAALEAELRAARALVEEESGEAEAQEEEIAALDTSLKRANGRLKLLLRAVKRSGGE